MAENKNGFILYKDLVHTVSQMPDDKAGQLFKTILEYVNDQDPEPQDLLIKVAFEPVKRQLKRDLKKWEDKSQKRSDAGKAGAEARWGKGKDDIANDAIAINSDDAAYDSMAKMADNVTVTDNDTDNVIDSEIMIYPTFDDFWELYDKKIDRQKCEKKFGRLSQNVKEEIMLYVKEYIIRTPDKKYRRNPETFLNNRTWENELPQLKTQNGHNNESIAERTARDTAAYFARKAGKPA